MSDSIWNATLEQFRDRLASVESVPAGVSTAAVSAACAIGLLTKVLKIVSRRKDFGGDRSLVSALLNQAQEASQKLSRLADRDIVVYRERSREMISVPIDVARAAAAGLALCHQAKPLVHALIAPDLGTAEELLTAAVRSTLLTVAFNLQQLPEDDPYRIEVTAELTLLSPPFRADR
jgi:formiminotetrahydrofolate cyclodeaminase